MLKVNNLEVTFNLRNGPVKALHNVTFTINKCERVGLVGESGAGKSVVGFSILNLLSIPGFISKGEVIFDGKDLTKLNYKDLRSIRGNRISMIFQDPMVTLNPVLTIGQQMLEVLTTHTKISPKEATKIVIDKLQKVQIPSPERRLQQYPHELSGGMRQRIVIAISLLLNPELIIADEPTTALDVTIQAEIMDLLLELCANQGVGILLITHDLGIIAKITQRAIVLYSGSIIEQGPTAQIIKNPQHPYTQGLLKALPQYSHPGRRLNQIPGIMPSLHRVPSGCAFHPRCEHCMEICQKEIPPLINNNNSQIACHLMKV